jgi:hypothetical protein
MDFSTFGVRESIILAVIVAVAYLLVSLLRLAFLKRSLRKKKVAKDFERNEDVVYGFARSRPSLADIAAKGKESSPVEPQQIASPMPFGDQLFRSSVEVELQQLRSEINSIKDSLAQMKASRRISPQYNEAMLLAQRGMSAQGIAGQCSISLGEAELIVALSRNKQEYEDHGSQYDE